MATNTTNYDLIKPEYADAADIADINSNMDVIDGAMNDNATAISTANTTITAHSQSIATNTADIATNAAAIATNAAAISSNSSAIAKLDSNTNSTKDILASALTCEKTTLFNGSGSSYTGVVPGNSNNYKYGVFTVNVRDTRRFVIAQGANNETAVNVYSGSAWNGWQELVSKNDVNSLFKIVNVSKYIITSGTLDAGSTGYTDVSVTIPSGYKTLGIASIVINHPGSSNGLQVSGGVGIEQTGTITTYVNYHSPKTVQASATDFNLVVLCIKSDYVLA